MDWPVCRWVSKVYAVFMSTVWCLSLTAEPLQWLYEGRSTSLHPAIWFPN